MPEAVHRVDAADAQRVAVDLGERSYDVVIGHGLLDVPAARIRHLLARRLDRHQFDSGTAVSESRASGAAEAPPPRAQRRAPDGEQYKDWPTLNRVFDALLQSRCDRGTTVYALGGGVVGDMAGFAAACFMRGVPYVQLPTTLLAQVDSSVGGKTAINHPMGKNMIGAFHQPRVVVCDLDTLSTLPDRELRAGLAEVIKYGPIADWAFFEWIEQHADDLLAREPGALQHAVGGRAKSRRTSWPAMSARSDLRAVLIVHTHRNPIEAGLGFGAWLHGEAVAAGMVLAAELSNRLGMIDDQTATRLVALLARCGLPTRAPALAAERFLELMRLDKKARDGDIRFTLLNGPGRAVVRSACDDLVREVVARTPQRA
jgi:3-dehydroquinate synthase